MSKKNQELKAHEIITAYYMGDTIYMDKYLVIASNTSKAVSIVPFKESETLLKAEELTHKIIIEGQNA